MSVRKSLAVTLTAVATVVGGVVANGSAAAERPAAKSASSQEAANVKVIRKFIREVLNNHKSAEPYFTSDAKFHAGTVGTVAGGKNVAGLLGSVTTSIPDLHASLKDIVAQGNRVVIRLVVTGTLQKPLLGIQASGQHLQWDAVDVYRLRGGKISEEWAAEDFTAILNTSGTYKAPWIQ